MLLDVEVHNTTRVLGHWHDVDKNELQAFVGVLMLMGICKLPRMEMYWTTTHPLTTPGLAEVMPLRRFMQILRYFHLCDVNLHVPRGQPGFDALFKVRAILDIITPLLESEYDPDEQLAVDEAMIHFKGRLGFKQYMKDKPTKWGIKVFALADSQNGYVYRFQIYTGKNSDLSTGDVGLCTRVVLELMNGLESRSYKVYVDTSPILFLRLYNKGVNACGTARKTRKYYPSQLAVRPSDVDRGYYKYLSSGPLLACVWKDKRIIHFLTTMHMANFECTALRRQVDGSRIDVRCPPCLPDYVRYM